MPIIGRNPWSEAGAYGEGLGSVLSQALLAMPQQRAQLAMQVNQQAAQQGFEAQRLSQARQQQQAEQAFHTSELQEQQHNNALQLTERQKQSLLAQKELEAAETRNGLLKSGKWSLTKDPATGRPILFNSTTGETKNPQGPDSQYAQLPAGFQGPMATPPVALGLGVDQQRGVPQEDASLAKTLSGFMNGSQQTNNPAVYNAATNFIANLVKSRLQGFSGQPGLGQQPQSAPMSPQAKASSPFKIIQVGQ